MRSLLKNDYEQSVIVIWVLEVMGLPFFRTL